MRKTRLILFSLICFLMIGVNFSYAFSLYTGTAPENIQINISAEQPIYANYYVNVYNESGTYLRREHLLPNTSNTIEYELMIQNLVLNKGERIKGYISTTNEYFGGSYSHNISVQCSVASKLVTASDDYIAVQNGHYDVYYKFEDENYSTFVSTWVSLHEVKEIFLQDTWYKGSSPGVHYWGSNVIDSTGCFYQGTWAGSDNGKGMYRAYIPAAAEYLKMNQYPYNDNPSYEVQSADIEIGNNNAFWFNAWNNGGGYTW